MKILFKYTTRSRPHHFERGMQSILANINPENTKYQILVSVDYDDGSMEAALSKYEEHSNVLICKGYSTNKINAINRDVEKANNDWDILVNMSDDMCFKVKGFDDIIRKNFDNLGQCLHFPDGNTIEIITLSVLGRKFYDRFGYIYHPDYISLWCDNEQTDVAKIVGAYKFVNEYLYDHLHPAFGKAQLDAQYLKTEGYYQADSYTYNRRKAINFGL
jgi:hypothetical protein